MSRREKLARIARKKSLGSSKSSLSDHRTLLLSKVLVSEGKDTDDIVVQSAVNELKSSTTTTPGGKTVMGKINDIFKGSNKIEDVKWLLTHQEEATGEDLIQVLSSNTRAVRFCKKLVKRLSSENAAGIQLQMMELMEKLLSMLIFHEQVLQFMGATGSTDPAQAASYLGMSKGDLESAIGLFVAIEHQGEGGRDFDGGGHSQWRLAFIRALVSANVLGQLLSVMEGNKGHRSLQRQAMILLWMLSENTKIPAKLFQHPCAIRLMVRAMKAFPKSYTIQSAGCAILFQYTSCSPHEGIRAIIRTPGCLRALAAAPRAFLGEEQLSSMVAQMFQRMTKHMYQAGKHYLQPHVPSCQTRVPMGFVGRNHYSSEDEEVVEPGVKEPPRKRPRLDPIREEEFEAAADKEETAYYRDYETCQI